MTIPIKYRKAPEVIASYDYTDIAEGTGVITFYGTREITSAATNYRLTTISTSPPASTGSPSSGCQASIRKDDSGATTYTFDAMPFNIPRYAKGTAYFICGTYPVQSTSHSIGAQLFHVDAASAETAISSLITSQSEGTAGVSRAFFLVLSLTEKQFKKGEYLRLKVTLTSAAAQSIFLGVDPTGSLVAYPQFTSTVSGRLAVDMPFRL